MKKVPFHVGMSLAAAPAGPRFAERASGSRIAPTMKALSSSVMYCASSSRLSFGRTACFGAAESDVVFDLAAGLLFWTSFRNDSIHAARAETKSGSSHSAYNELALRVSPEGATCQ